MKGKPTNRSLLLLLGRSCQQAKVDSCMAGSVKADHRRSTKPENQLEISSQCLKGFLLLTFLGLCPCVVHLLTSEKIPNLDIFGGRISITMTRVLQNMHKCTQANKMNQTAPKVTKSAPQKSALQSPQSLSHNKRELTSRDKFQSRVYRVIKRYPLP